MSWNETKPSDPEDRVLKIWGMLITTSLPLLVGLLWPGVVVFVRVSTISQM